MTGAAIHRPVCPDGRTIGDLPCDEPCAERSRPFVLLATIVASAMAFIDGSIVTIALPAIQADLGAGFGVLQWIVNAYALMLGALILIGGAAGDRFGRRRVFVTGIVVFAIASIVCALAPSASALMIARALQGIGAALLVPQSLAIIAAAFPKEVRGRAIGLWAGASAITTALGPPIGGLLIDFASWRAIFWLNLPFAAVALWASASHVPESRDESADGPLDWRGAAAACVALGLLTAGLTLFAEDGGSPAVPVAMLGTGLCALIVFLRTERRSPAPILPLVLFRDRVFTSMNVMTLFLYGALTGVLFLLPFELIERRGLSATEVGLTLLPLGIVIGTLSRVAGDWADRNGPRMALVAGSGAVAAAAAGLAINADSLWLGVVLPVVVLSLGMAAVVAPLTTTVMNAAPEHQAGAASGVNNAASRVAGLFAVAIIGAIASSVFGASLGAEAAGQRFGALPDPGSPLRGVVEAAFVDAYAVAMMTAGVWSALAALIASATVSPAAAGAPAAGADRGSGAQGDEWRG